jgi:DNA-binding CsgD family transcriptional regulator
MMHSLPVAVQVHRNQEQAQIRSNRFEEINAEEIQAGMAPWAPPGILILNREGEVLHQNREARAITEALAGKNTGIVFEIYLAFKQGDGVDPGGEGRSGPLRERVCRHNGAVYLFRPVLLQPQGDESGFTQLLILIERVFQDPGLGPCEEPIRLTPREKSVVALLSQGMTNKEVAHSMHIGEYTVKHHVKQIMRKFRVTTRAGIVAKSFSHRHDLNFETDVTPAKVV